MESYEAVQNAEYETDDAQAAREPPSERREFALNLPEGFRELWQITEAWERIPVHCSVILGHSTLELCNISSDGVLSKRKCREQGEKILRKAYQQACRYLDPDSSTGFPQQAYHCLSRKLNEHFEEARRCVGRMTKAGITREEAQSLLDALDFENIAPVLKKDLSDELEENRFYYRLDSFACYAEDIEIDDTDDEMEEGFWRLVELAAVRYTYDISDPYFQLQDDLFDLAAAYQKDAGERVRHDLSFWCGRKIRDVLEGIEKRLAM